MAAKKPAEVTPTTITATELAELVERDPKQVRAFLRKEFARNPEVKGSTWKIDSELQEKVVQHFEALNARKEVKAS